LRRVIEVAPEGLFCPAGDFHIDPRRGVARALITHAHSDHARPGSQAYLCAEPGAGLLAARLGGKANITGIAYGQTVSMDGVRVSFHPAGHVLGSAQIRIEHHGEVWVVSGDYKLDADPTCCPFEPIRCHTFVSESTFGLPLFHWPPTTEVVADLHAWWIANQHAGRTSVIFAYAFGKTQRLLAHLDTSIGPVLVHEAAHRLLACYRAAGVPLPPVAPATDENIRRIAGRGLVIASPTSDPSALLNLSGPPSTAFVSGWMLLRKMQRDRGVGRGVGRGFVLSDHADWTGLVTAIGASGANLVLTTHGYAEPLARYLRENGRPAEVLPTHRG